MLLYNADQTTELLEQEVSKIVIRRTNYIHHARNYLRNVGNRFYAQSREDEGYRFDNLDVENKRNILALCSSTGNIFKEGVSLATTIMLHIPPYDA